MDLYKEILINALAKQTVEIDFPNLTLNAEQIVVNECYRALKKIKAIIHDDSLSDAECFEQIEMVICVLEEIGSNGGVRHDF